MPTRYTIRVYKDITDTLFESAATVGRSPHSHHPHAAVDAVIDAWKEHRDNPDGVNVELPSEVEAILRSRGTLPWDGRSAR